MDHLELALYTRLEQLNAQGSRLHLWPLRCYASIARVSVVPVSLLEFRPLASIFPLAFMQVEGSFRPVSIVGLPGFRNDNFWKIQPEVLPLLLRAFPLAIGPPDVDEHMTVLIDEPPSSPGEPGIAAFDADGQMSEELSARADALWLYAKLQKATATAVSDIARLGALEAWPLHLVFENGDLPVSGLFRVSSKFLQSKDYSEYLEIHVLKLRRRYSIKLAALLRSTCFLSLNRFLDCIVMIFLTNPLHYALHHDLRWRLATRYPFAADQQALPLARSEVGLVARHLIVTVQTVGERRQVVAVIKSTVYRTSPLTAEGEWQRGPVPLSLRLHPPSAPSATEMIQIVFFWASARIQIVWARNMKKHFLIIWLDLCPKLSQFNAASCRLLMRSNNLMLLPTVFTS